jgi:uncharacterized membrane protein YecN with MAPEG domain
MLIITSFTTAILAILLVVLSIFTIMARRRFKIAISDNGEMALVKFIRAHGNLAEFAPIFLFLLLLVEINHLLSVTWLWSIALLFIFGRFSHAASLLYLEHKTMNFRILGMMLTFTTILTLSFVLIFKLSIH